LYTSVAFKTETGKHYLSTTGEPTWESTDGSKVSAVKVQQVASATSIPWLLLKATTTAGFGKLQTATYVQRLSTAGGKAPVTDADRAHKGQYVRVPYTAEYLFYGPQ
jgi:hypothetical protein